MVVIAGLERRGLPTGLMLDLSIGPPLVTHPDQTLRMLLVVRLHHGEPLVQSSIDAPLDR